MTWPKKCLAKALAPAGLFTRASAGTSAGYAAVGAVVALGVAVVVGVVVAVLDPLVAVAVVPGPPVDDVHPVRAPATSAPAATSAPRRAAYPADVPAEARVNSPAGAKAFAKHFFGQVNKAYTTPQAGLLAPLSTPNCKTCTVFETTAAGFVAQSQRYDRAAVSILEVSIDSDPPPAGITLVDVVVRQLPAKVIDGKGKTVVSVTEEKGVFVVQLRFDTAGWAVDTIQVMG